MNLLLRKVILLPSLIVLLWNTTLCQSIQTIAGKGSSGYTGDQDASTNAQLRNPWGIAMDHSGNLYIADYGNHHVRMINSTDGKIKNVAGGLQEEFSWVGRFNGDNIISERAYLHAPMSVAIDSHNNIYIADDGNFRIRKVDAVTGMISTVAGNGEQGYSGDGGPALNARLGDPWHIFFDGADNLYITEYSNNCIRKVDVSSGVITTIAGNGQQGYSGDGGLPTKATLNLPVAAAIDFNGNIYIADYGNNRIRKVCAETGIISTVAGNGEEGYDENGIPAISARLGHPGGLAVDASGNIYFADSDNNRIRRISASTGTVTTIAGIGEQGYGGNVTDPLASSLSGPQSIILYGGHLYFSDTYNHSVRMVTNVYEPHQVSFLSFDLKSNGESSDLEWQIDDREGMTAYYTVQISMDSINWKTVKTIPSEDSAGRDRYKTTLSEAGKASNFRIVAVKRDQGTVISEIQGTVTTEIKKENKALLLFPNPVSDYFILDLGQSPYSQTAFWITDLRGNRIMAGAINNQLQKINTSQLPAGFYILNLLDGRILRFLKR